MDQNNQVEQVKEEASQVSTEGGNSSEPAGESTPAPEKTLEEKIREKGSVAPDAVKTEAQAVAEYKANLKFKAAGKEMEVPKFLHSVMKDKESEQYLHSVLSKAHGIEMIQGRLKETRESRDQLNQAYNQVMEPINYAREAYQRNDMDTVFDTLKIDPNKVLQWAYNKVQLSQMPADQRQIYEAKSLAEKRAWELEKQNQQFQTQSVQMQSEQIGQMLEVVLERPDYSAVAQAYDGRKGQPGSFRNLVIQMGDMAYQQTGKVISPIEAAQKAVELLGEKLGQPAMQAAVQQQVPQQAPAPSVPQKVVLPNVGGAKASAPAKSKIRSLDDIKKMHQKFQNA